MNGQQLHALFGRLAVEQINCEMPTWGEACLTNDDRVWDALAADLGAITRAALYEQETVDEVLAKIRSGLDGKKDANATWRSAVSTQEGAVRDILDGIAARIAPR